MHIVFYSTNNVFKTEEILTSHNIKCKVVPTPVSDKAYCGVCIQTDENVEHLIGDMEHKIIT